MRKVIAVMIILLLHTVMLVAAELPTVEEILNKVAQQAQVQKDNLHDLQCRQTVTIETPTGTTVTTRSDFYLKAGGMQKNIVYQEDGSRSQTQIIRNGELKVIDYKGQVFTKKTSELLTTEEKTQLKDELDTKALPGVLDYETNPANFLQAYTVTRDINRSNASQNTYWLKVENALDPLTRKPKLNDFFSRLEIEIDTNKGVVLKELLYDQEGILQIEETFEDYRQYGGEPNTFWYCGKIASRLRAKSGSYVTKTVVQDTLKFNQGLIAEFFEYNQR